MLTPPDPMSQIGLALPTILLYEVAIIASRWVEKKRAQERGESDEKSPPESTLPREVEEKAEAKAGE